MGIKYGWNLVLLFCLSFLFRSVEGVRVVVDDMDAQVVYSNSGPSWLGVNNLPQQGRYLSGHSALSSGGPFDASWHEVFGDGAVVTLNFTGTSISLNVSLCTMRYDTVVNFFIDGESKGTFTHYAVHNATKYCDNPEFLVTIADFDGLPPAQHTFKAVTVGQVVFAVDSFTYEASDAAPVSSSPVGSSLLGTTNATSSMSTSTTSLSTSTSTTTSSSASSSTHSTSSARDPQPAVSLMDVSAADSRISYAPLGAWKPYSNARRATSCLDGTMSSSTVNSSLTYNFTGSAIQVYIISSPNGANFGISIDGENQGTYSSYNASADLSTCSLIAMALDSVTNLADTQHTLVLTVLDQPSGSTQDTVQFVGFRTPSSSGVSTPSSSASAGPNLAPIIGGVVGGLAGLLLLVLFVIWWMRRQRRIEEADALYKMPDPLHSSFSSTSKAQRAFLGNDQGHQLAESGPSMDAHTPPMVQREQSVVSSGFAGLALLDPPPPSRRTDGDADEDEDDESRERLTYYTLPSYHGNVVQAAAASNLSEADVNAISRRLQEVMRNQMGQSGRDPNEPVVMPPRELIEHLVEEQLQPRAV